MSSCRTVWLELSVSQTGLGVGARLSWLEVGMAEMMRSCSRDSDTASCSPSDSSDPASLGLDLVDMGLPSSRNDLVESESNEEEETKGCGDSMIFSPIVSKSAFSEPGLVSRCGGVASLVSAPPPRTRPSSTSSPVTASPCSWPRWVRRSSGRSP